MQALVKFVPMALTIFLASTAVAEDTNEKQHKRHGPPPVAIDACVAAIDGDQCSFDGRHGDTLSGQCATSREDVLACRPEGGPPRLQRHDHGQSEEVQAEEVESSEE
jgi:hypothetical protein